MHGKPRPGAPQLSLDLDKNPQQADRASARAVFDLDVPQLKGTATITARPVIAAVRGIDLDALGRSEINLESKLSASRAVRVAGAAGARSRDRRGRWPGAIRRLLTGVWRAPLRLKVKMGGGLDAEAEGTAEPWAAEPKASVNLKVRSVDLAPLFDLKPSADPVRNISLSSRVSLAGNRLSFDDLDSTISGSRLRGRLALILDQEKNVEGEVGLDTLDLGPAFAACDRRRDTMPPSRSVRALEGLAWSHRVPGPARRAARRRRIAPGQRRGQERRPVAGSIDQARHRRRRGERHYHARVTANGIALNARVQFSGVEGAALRYRGLKMPEGRACR